jgi:hypothetical protein
MSEHKYYSIGVSKKDFDTFVKLHESRKQDTTRADTFAYLMEYHTAMQEFKPHPRTTTGDQP